MSNNENGGPAFAFASSHRFHEGMTLRDYFAIHVDSREVDRYVAGNEFRPTSISRENARYAIADAMLKERNK